jgi:hypothetical protein
VEIHVLVEIHALLKSVGPPAKEIQLWTLLGESSRPYRLSHPEPNRPPFLQCHHLHQFLVVGVQEVRPNLKIRLQNATVAKIKLLHHLPFLREHLLRVPQLYRQPSHLHQGLQMYHHHQYLQVKAKEIKRKLKA